MISAVQSALSGLRTAGARLEQSAADIARSGAQAVSSVVPREDEGPAVGGDTGSLPVPGATQAAADPNAPSLTDGLFAAKQAELQYKANARLLGALNDLQRETIDILS